MELVVRYEGRGHNGNLLTFLARTTQLKHFLEKWDLSEIVLWCLYEKPPSVKHNLPIQWHIQANKYGLCWGHKQFEVNDIYKLSTNKEWSNFQEFWREIWRSQRWGNNIKYWKGSSQDLLESSKREGERYRRIDRKWTGWGRRRVKEENQKSIEGRKNKNIPDGTKE